MTRFLAGMIIAACLFAGGFIIGRTTSRLPEIKTTLTQNIEKPQTRQIESPEGRSYSELFQWSLDPIEVYRTLSGGVLTIRATDTHKETVVKDKISFSIPRHTLTASPVLLFDGRIKTGGALWYSYRLTDALSVSALAGFGQGFLLAGAGVGFSW